MHYETIRRRRIYRITIQQLQNKISDLKSMHLLEKEEVRSQGNL